MSVAAKLRDRLRNDERGFTLIELVTVLGMLLIVMTALSYALIAASKAEEDMNRRFASQINARIALDQLRREIHCASNVSPTGASSSITIVLGSRCPSAAGGTTVSWCTTGSGTRFALYRLVGATCDATGKKAVDYLTNGTVFSFAPQSVTSLAVLSVTLPVNTRPASALPDYRLTDDIVLRNSSLDLEVPAASLPLTGDARTRRSGFSGAGSPEGAAVLESPLGALRLSLGDERGIALPFALGVMVILSALSAGIFTYVTMNQGATRRVEADQRAYGLAETGLSYAFSRLENAADPYSASSVPSTTVMLPTGTVTYVGTLSGTTWTLTGTGTARNPSGPYAADVVRMVSAQAQVTTSAVPDMRSWNYLFVDQPSGCISMGNSVSIDVALYVRGDLCLTNTAQIDSPAVYLFGQLYVSNTAGVGSVGNPIEGFAATGACHYSGSPVACGPASHVYAATIGTNPPSIAKPTVDLPYWYANADLGPQSNCTSGSFPGGFDTDAVLNVSRGSVDLTPAAAYDCRRVEGGVEVARLSWAPGSPGTLTIKGTIYFDGDLTWSNLNLIQYDGRATIYASGQITIPNHADLCGVPACDAAWNPDVDLLVFVAGSKTSATSTAATSVTIGNLVTFQGAIYAVNDVSVSNNTTLWGPVIARSASIANSTTIHPSPIPIEEYMLGTPLATLTVVNVDPVQGSYSG